MSDNRSGTTASVAVALGVVAGIAFMGWVGKPAPVAVAAPAIDYSRITDAVRAGFPAPAPVAVAAPVKPAPAPVADPAPVKRKVHKVHRAAAPARVVYWVPAYSGCTCHL